MAVRGSLQDLDLLSLLQMTCEEGGDAQITLQRGVDTATLYIQAGQIVHAEGQSRTGEEVVYEVLAWKHGTFALARTVPAPTLTIRRDWNSLLLEGLRRLDEQAGTVDEHEVEIKHKTVLAVSDSAPLLATIQAAIAPFSSELSLVTAKTQADAMNLLAHHPDVLVVAWYGAPTAQSTLFAHLIGQKVPVPTVLLVRSDEPRLPSVSPLNPAVFLRTPPDESEVLAAVWGQVAREATGEPVGLPLYTLCEWVRLEKHTCLIRVTAPHDEGMLAFVDGLLLNAVSGQKLGEVAVKAILGWEGITIEFGTVGAKVKPLIQRSLKAILSGTDEITTSRPAVVETSNTSNATLIVLESLPADTIVPTKAGKQTDSLSLPSIGQGMFTNGDDSVPPPDLPAEHPKGDDPLPEQVIKEERTPLQDTDPAPLPTEGIALPSETDADLSDTSVPAEVALADTETMSSLVPPVSDTDMAASSTIHGDVIPDVSPSLIGVEEMATTESKIEKTLAEIMTIGGAMGVALVDVTSGMALGKVGNTGLDLDIAAAGNSEVVKSKMKVMKDLGIKGDIEDILITLGTQYHLIRPLGSDSSLFLYVVLNKDTANLALARRQLSKSEAGLVM